VLRGAGEVRQQVEAVDVDLEGLARGVMPDFQLLDDVGLAGCRKEGG
jgi:hypothetical protein